MPFPKATKIEPLYTTADGVFERLLEKDAKLDSDAQRYEDSETGKVIWLKKKPWKIAPENPLPAAPAEQKPKLAS
jgi:hypothetical protein